MKTPSSAKAKGRRFQQWVRDQLIEQLNVHPEDVESRSMGAGGEDLIMARAAREKFPVFIVLSARIKKHLMSMEVLRTVQNQRWWRQRQALFTPMGNDMNQ